MISPGNENKVTKMLTKRIRFLWIVFCAVISPLLLAGSVTGQQYGDDEQYGGWGRPKYQQVSSLPQYESSEQPQAPRHQQGSSQPSQQQYYPQGTGDSPQFSGTPPQHQQQPQQDGTQQQPNLWWQGQNAFQPPPGHPGVEQKMPLQQQPQAQQQHLQPNYNPDYESYRSTTPKYNVLGNGGLPSTTPDSAPAFNHAPQPQTPQESFANPPPPPTPFPQQPNIEPQPSPVAEHATSSDSSNPPPPPPPPQKPSTIGSGGWSQNPQGGAFGQPPVESVPGCDLINERDCHNNRPKFNPPYPPSPSQNYQPPPQFQLEQQPYQPASQKNYQPTPQPNLAYEPSSTKPPSQQPQRPNQPEQQASLPNNRYQNNQQSSSNNQQFRPQSPQRKPYTPPQAPRPIPNSQQQYQQEQPQDPGTPYPGCPAAMKCVQDEYCNSIGLIEDARIQFSAADRIHRVALMQCSEKMTGVVGVCCRDPNYKDPWPDMKNGGGHRLHHPDKGHSQGQPSFQPPQGNHLQNGNPYSGK